MYIETYPSSVFEGYETIQQAKNVFKVQLTLVQQICAMRMKISYSSTTTISLTTFFGCLSGISVTKKRKPNRKVHLGASLVTLASIFLHAEDLFGYTLTTSTQP